MHYSIAAAICDQFRHVPEVSNYATDLSGKTVIITGANVGLGYEAAKHIAAMKPAKLVLACRDEQKGQDAASVIAQVTGYGNVVCWQLDISDPESVKLFVDKFESEGGGKLDILIENAGVSNMALKRAVTGWEQMIGTNHLGTAQLAVRMLPFLLRAEKPRLVIVASDTHYWVSDPEGADKPELLRRLNDDIAESKFEGIGQRYMVSKLLNVLFVRAFASHLPGSSSLTVNSVNPGFCRSALLRSVNPLIVAPTRLLARTTEVGSRTFVHAAVAPELEGVRGEYLNLCKVTEPSDFVISDGGKRAADSLWVETMEVLSGLDDRVPGILRTHLH